MTNDNTARRAEYVNEVLPILYPEPWRRDTSGAEGTTAAGEGRAARPGGDAEAFGSGRPSGAGRTVRMIAVPNIRRPRLLVPANSPKVAAAALARYARPPSRLARLKRDAAVLALRTGMSRLLLRDRITVTTSDPEADSLAGYLSGVLDTPLHISVHIGPARANRKPVVQLLTERGQTIAFAKIGVNPLTRRLVAEETEALQRLAKAELSKVTVPGVRHAGPWREHQVLVQQALPIWNDRVAVQPGRLAEAMREIATVEGVHNRRLDESEYLTTLRARLDALDDTADARELRSAAVELLDAAADERLTFGAWHGDWTPWNMAMLADTVLVWDWERFCLEAPVGFDALHYRLQHDIVVAHRDPSAAVDHCINKSGALLAPFFPAHPAPAPPRLARLTALLYLIDLATRYLTDRQAEAGARLGALGTWLLPVLVRRVSAFATSDGAVVGSTSPEGN